ncbi:MAG: hypothetical protein Q7S87_10030 [Agitococcus sp.]|nr:hypothetical protein [Agitococcus sp.]
MRQSQKKKATLCKQRLVEITYERDYHDEAWQTQAESVPTPESHPDAFYRKVIDVNEPARRQSTRLKPPQTLSKRQLAKRLHRVGLEGAELRRIVSEIKNGPGLMFSSGLTAMGWHTSILRQRYGRRVANAVLKFVRTRFLALDEGGALFANASVTKCISDSFHTVRKVNSGGQGFSAQLATDFGGHTSFFSSPDDGANQVALLS